MPSLENPKLELTNLSHHLKQKALLDHLVWISIYHISLSGWIQKLQLKLTWSWANIKVSFYLIYHRGSCHRISIWIPKPVLKHVPLQESGWVNSQPSIFLSLMLSLKEISLLSKWAGFSDWKLWIQRIILFQLLRHCFILVDCLACSWPGCKSLLCFKQLLAHFTCSNFVPSQAITFNILSKHHFHVLGVKK